MIPSLMIDMIVVVVVVFLASDDRTGSAARKKTRSVKGRLVFFFSPHARSIYADSGSRAGGGWEVLSTFLCGPVLLRVLLVWFVLAALFGWLVVCFHFIKSLKTM